jgi:hypothetical protein
MTTGGWPEYPFLEAAAAEARQASRRYWAEGGDADRRYPRQPMPWWPEAPDPDEIDKSEPQTERGLAG